MFTPVKETHYYRNKSSFSRAIFLRTTQGSRRRERPILSNRIMGERQAPLDLMPTIDEGLMTFHRELTETCIDLMARYTFATYSARSKR